MSRFLGDPARDCIILGEGNTSARVDADSFYVKASGASLVDCTTNSFVQINVNAVNKLLAQSSLTDAEVAAGLATARIPSKNETNKSNLKPSVETFLHAVCLQLPGINFIGHTHPTAVNKLTCSNHFETALGGRLFPDEIVVCGSAPLLVPYTDPGFVLALQLQKQIGAYTTTHQTNPRTIYLQNHGFIALGSTAGEVKDITAMAVKAATILQGTYALGGPRFLDQATVQRLATRPDEKYRQQILGYD